METMENIRFRCRAKDKHGKWVVGYYCELLPYTPCMAEDVDETKREHYIARPSFSDWGMPRNLELVPIDINTLCQCTGLWVERTYEKDKKPKKSPLYENDIVELGEDTGIKGIVKWDDTICAFVVVNDDGETISIVSDVAPIYKTGNKFDKK